MTNDSKWKILQNLSFNVTESFSHDEEVTRDKIYSIISSYFECNNLNPLEVLSPDDCSFIIDDLSKNGLFHGKNKSAAIYQIVKKHQALIESSN